MAFLHHRDAHPALGQAAVAGEAQRQAGMGQGLAVAAFYARRLAGPPFLRAVVVVLVLVNPWAPQILALLGLFDNWIDFRKWAEPPETRGA